MKILPALLEQGSATVKRSVVKFTANDTYISQFSFGDNKQLGNAKLFVTKASAQQHIKDLGSPEKWEVVEVSVTVKLS